MDRKGQAYTLEAVVASLVLLSSLVFALQVTAVTPLSASTSSQHIETQQQAIGDGVLAIGEETGALKRAVLFWGDADTDSEFEFHGADNNRYFINDLPDNEFGELLEQAYGGRGIAFNVYVTYQSGDTWVRQRMVFRGEPSNNAVRATRPVALYDDDVLRDPDEQPTTTTLDSTSDFYAPDDSSGTGVYTVVRVEVVAWRM